MDVSVGQKANREINVTEEMVKAYAEITGDYNPLHFDPGVHQPDTFRTAHGPRRHNHRLLHTLVAMDMPGSGTVFVNQNWNFTKPVYIVTPCVLRRP